MLENLTFRQIRDLKKDYGYGSSTSINDFSDLLNRSTGRNVADAGLGGIFETGVKSYSAAVDDLLNKHAAPVQNLLAKAGEGLFGMFGADREVGRQVGHDALRGVVDFAPAIIGSVLAPGVGTGIGLAATSAMSAANALEKSDSVGHTLLAGALPFAVGPLTSLGARATLGTVGSTIGKTNLLKSLGITGGTKEVVQVMSKFGTPEWVERTVARNVGDRILGFVGGETAVNAGSMLAEGGVNYNETGEWTNPFTKENMLANLVDPTAIMGLSEMFSPSVVKSQRVDDIARIAKANSGVIEHKSLKETRPDLTGATIGEIESQYNILERQLLNIHDRVQRERTRVLLKEAKEEAYENLHEQTTETISSLFGKKLQTEWNVAPKTEKILDEKGQAITKVVTPSQVLTPELNNPETVIPTRKGKIKKFTTDSQGKKVLLKEDDKEPETDLLQQRFDSLDAEENKTGSYLQQIGHIAKNSGVIKTKEDYAELADLINATDQSPEAIRAVYAGYSHKKLSEAGLSDNSIVRSELLKEAPEPTTIEESVDIIESVQKIRKDLGSSDLTDAEMRHQLEVLVKLGNSLEEAHDILIQSLRTDALGKVKRALGRKLPATRKGVEEAAVKGSKGGRPQRGYNAIEKRQMDWVQGHKYEILPDPMLQADRDAEVALYEEILNKPHYTEQKARWEVNLAKAFEQWDRDREARFLTKDGKRQDDLTEAELREILRTRLEAVHRNSGKPLATKSVKSSETSAQNVKFPDKQSAQAYADKLAKEGVLVNGELFQVTTNVVKHKKSGYVVKWKPKEGGFGPTPELVDHIIFDEIDQPQDVYDELAMESKAEVIQEVVHSMGDEIINHHVSKLDPVEQEELKKPDVVIPVKRPKKSQPKLVEKIQEVLHTDEAREPEVVQEIFPQSFVDTIDQIGIGTKDKDGDDTTIWKPSKEGSVLRQTYTTLKFEDGAPGFELNTIPEAKENADGTVDYPAFKEEYYIQTNDGRVHTYIIKQAFGDVSIIKKNSFRGEVEEIVMSQGYLKLIDDTYYITERSSNKDLVKKEISKEVKKQTLKKKTEAISDLIKHYDDTKEDDFDLIEKDREFSFGDEGEKDWGDLDWGTRPNFGGDQSKGVQAFERGVTPQAVFNRQLEKVGMTPEAIKEIQPSVQKLVDLFGADDVVFFDIVKGDVRGASTMGEGLRAVFLGEKGLADLSDQDRVDALNFVTGHELAHTVEQLHKNGRMSDRAASNYEKFSKAIDEGTTDDRLLMLELMSDQLPKHLRTSEVVTIAKNSADNPQETRANLLSMWAMSQMNPPDGFLYKIMPAEFRKGLQVLSDFAHSIYGALKGTASVFTGFKSRSNMRKTLADMVKMAEQFKTMHKEAIEFETESSKLANLGGRGVFSDTLAYFTETDALPDDRRGKATKVFDEVIRTFDQMASGNPTLEGINRVLHNFQSGTKASIKRSVSVLFGGLDEKGHLVFTSDGSAAPRYTGHKSAKPLTQRDWEKVSRKPKLNKLASDWMRLHNTIEWTDSDGNTRQGKKLSYLELKKEAPELYNALQKLSGPDKNAVIQVVHRSSEMMQHFSQVESMRAMEAGDLSVLEMLIGNKHEELWQQAPELAQQMHEAVVLMNKSRDPNNPNALLDGENAKIILSQLATVLPVDTFRRVLETAKDQNANRLDLFASFKERDYFFSEIRTGKYLLKWTEPDGKPGSLGFATLEDAQRYQAKLNERGIVATRDQVRRGVFLNGKDKLSEMLAAYDEKNKAMVDSLDLPDEIKNQLKSMLDYSSLLQRELAGAEIIKHGSDRVYAAGREDLNMIQTQLMYINSATRALHKRIFNAKLQYQFSNPSLRDPKIQADMPVVMSYIENFLTPDTELGTTIQKANTAFYLGFNLSNHILEMGQPAFSFIPELQMRGYSWSEGVRMVHAAQEQCLLHTIANTPSNIRKLGKKVTKQSYAGKDLEGSWQKPEYNDLMKRAVEADAISLSHASEVIEADVSSNTDLSGVIGRQGKPSKSRFITSPVKMLANSSIKLYQQFTEHNSRVSLIVGYETARAKGMSHEDAIPYAIEFSRVVTYSGGKANRPSLPFSNKGHFRTFGQAMMSLSSYTTNMLSQMRRYAETAYASRQYPHITEADRTNARRALRTMIATQFFGAGLVGLPFAGAAMAVFSQLTGVDLEKEMREGLSELLEEDKSNDGGLLSDVVMNGGANALLSRVMPGAPDVGSRFALGNIMGVNSFDGFSLSSLAGPTGNLVDSVAKGATSLLRDRNPGQALEDVAPVAWKKIIEMIRTDGEFRADGGGLLIDSNAGEKLSYMVGFVPQNVRRLKNYERLRRRQEEMNREKDIRFYDDLAETYKDNPIRVSNILREKADKDAKVKLLQDHGYVEEAEKEKFRIVKEGGQKIAERVEKQTFVRDPLRDGTFLSGTQMTGVAQQLKVNKQQTREVDRLKTRHNVLRSLGLEQEIDKTTFARSAVIDMIREKNPRITYSQAVVLADRYLSRNPSLKATLAPFR